MAVTGHPLILAVILLGYDIFVYGAVSVKSWEKIVNDKCLKGFTLIGNDVTETYINLPCEEVDQMKLVTTTLWFAYGDPRTDNLAFFSVGDQDLTIFNKKTGECIDRIHNDNGKPTYEKMACDYVKNRAAQFIDENKKAQ